MMASLVFRCLLLVLGIARTEASLSISASVDGLSPDGFHVTVTCNMTGNPSPSAVQQVALTVSRTRGQSSNPAIPEASISAFEQGQVTKDDSFQGTAEGTFDRKTQTALLQVKFKNVGRREIAGEFVCESTGLNRFGRCVRERETKKLTLEDLDLDLVAQDYTSRPSKKDDDHHDLELQRCKAALKPLLEKNFALLKRQREIFWATGLFNESSYYALTKDADQCTDVDKLGGYLAEINTEEEFDFLEQTIFSSGFGFPSGDNFILTGAKYDTLDGPFKFVRHPDHPVFLDRWAEDEPDRDNLTFNWLLLKKVGSKRMLMYDGIFKNPDLNYLCEIEL